ncbi:hypothetical protein AB0442_42380, partial [Kitasatospora sp. NPDC085895]
MRQLPLARVIAVAAATLIGLPLAGPALAAVTVTQDSLAPTTMTAGVPAKATLTVHSSSCFTAKTLGVGVRDAAGQNLDFPGNASNVRICPSGVTFTSQSRTLPAGSYTEFGFWQDSANVWHNLPSRTLTVSAAPGPVPGKSLTWSDEFNAPIAWGSTWVGDKTSAYRYGDHNPDDNKLDWLTTGAVGVSGGVATFTAKPSAHVLENGKQAWDTGLLTTEGSTQGFQVRTGDYVETRV